MNMDQPWGMPNVGCYYAGGSLRGNRVKEGACCVVCGEPLPNSHHEPPIGSCGVETLRTKYGIFVLTPALIALCGSGTTGCHGARHEGKLKIEWVWDSEEGREAWFSGELLAHSLSNHDERLFEFGHYEISVEGKRKVVVRDGRS